MYFLAPRGGESVRCARGSRHRLGLSFESDLLERQCVHSIGLAEHRVRRHVLAVLVDQHLELLGADRLLDLIKALY